MSPSLLLLKRRLLATLFMLRNKTGPSLLTSASNKTWPPHAIFLAIRTGTSFGFDETRLRIDHAVSASRSLDKIWVLLHKNLVVLFGIPRERKD